MLRRLTTCHPAGCLWLFLPIFSPNYQLLKRLTTGPNGQSGNSQTPSVGIRGLARRRRQPRRARPCHRGRQGPQTPRSADAPELARLLALHIGRRRSGGRLSAPSRPTCWRPNVAPSRELLVDQLKMATGAKSLVHDPPGERRFQERRTRPYDQGRPGWHPGRCPSAFRHYGPPGHRRQIRRSSPGRTMHHNFSLRPAAPGIPHCRRSPRAGRPRSRIIGLMSSRQTFS